MDMETVKREIPVQLQKECFGFIKLREKSKIPIESNWQNTPHSFQEVSNWLENGFNYGVLGGYGDLIIIDADTPEISQLIKERFPNTFTVKSSQKSEHRYFFGKGINKKIILRKGDTHYGEIISQGSQVVGPGSIHPDTGTEYQVINDVSIAEISREQIFSELIEYIPVEFPEADKEIELENIRIIDVLNKKNIQTRQVGGQLVCGHPIHGSTNGNNFVVNPEKNVWHCFRCNSGGGPLSLIAVLEGVIECHEAVAGNLRGDKFKKTCRIAGNKYGFDIKTKKTEKSDKARKPPSSDELIKMLDDEQNQRTIHPAQDFVDGLMTFAVKIKDVSCLITSDKRLIPLEGAMEAGFMLKQKNVDTFRFSAKGIKAFIGGKEIDIPALYQEVHDYIKRFIHFPDENYLTFVTLWVMGTYIFMLFRYCPYVWLNAEKGSGKTLLMEILSAIAFNGELITNPTEAVIFRDISNNQLTMFIDEVEQLRKRDKDTYGSLISLLNNGFNKSGLIKRSEKAEKGEYALKSYSAYSPKMFAGINEIDDVLQDRTVRIPLLRKKDNEDVQRYKETPEIIELQQNIRDDLYIFALTNASDLAEIYNEDRIEGLGHLCNRELDIWEPILLLANVIESLSNGLDLTNKMEALSKKSLEEKQADSVAQNETYKLLTILKAMLEEKSPCVVEGDNQIYEAEVVFEYFKGNEDYDWIEKTNVLTRRLKKVKVKSEQKRIDGDKKRVYTINIKDFQDLCERYKI